MIFKSRTFIGDIRTGALHFFIGMIFLNWTKFAYFWQTNIIADLKKKLFLQTFQFAILQRNTEKLATKYMDAPLQYIVN